MRASTYCLLICLSLMSYLSVAQQKETNQANYYQLVDEVLSGVDHYTILQISDHEATKSVIKKAFYQLSIQYHPDKQAVKSVETEEKYLKIQRAYQVLSDDTLREIYDKFLKEGVPLEKRLYGRWAHYYGAPEHDLSTVVTATVIVTTALHFFLKYQRYNRVVEQAKKTATYKQKINQMKAEGTIDPEKPELEVQFTGMEKPNWKHLLPIAIIIWVIKTTYFCSWYVICVLILRKTYDKDLEIMKQYNLTREELEEQREIYKQKMEKRYHSAKGKRMRRMMKKYNAGLPLR